MPGKSKKGGGLEVGSAYKMKNSALHTSAKYGSPMQANYATPMRATDPTQGMTDKKKTKSKDPIGDWLRAAGKQLKDDFGKGGNLEKDIQKKSDAVEGVVRGVEGNITKQVKQVGSNLSKGKKKLESNLKGAGDQIRGDLGNLHKFLQGKRKYNKETKKWEDK